MKYKALSGLPTQQIWRLSLLQIRPVLHHTYFKTSCYDVKAQGRSSFLLGRSVCFGGFCSSLIPFLFFSSLVFTRSLSRGEHLRPCVRLSSPDPKTAPLPSWTSSCLRAFSQTAPGPEWPIVSNPAPVIFSPSTHKAAAPATAHLVAYIDTRAHGRLYKSERAPCVNMVHAVTRTHKHPSRTVRQPRAFFPFLFFLLTVHLRPRCAVCSEVLLSAGCFAFPPWNM